MLQSNKRIHQLFPKAKIPSPYTVVLLAWETFFSSPSFMNGSSKKQIGGKIFPLTWKIREKGQNSLSHFAHFYGNQPRPIIKEIDNNPLSSFLTVTQ